MTPNTCGNEMKSQKDVKRPAAYASETATDADLRLLNLFNQYRHDWMNEIQILMGYVQLKKYDKLPALMGKIKEKIQKETYISKLGIPSLIVMLLTFQTEVKELRLMVMMEEEIHFQKLKTPEAAGKWIAALLECFREEALLYQDDQNSLELCMNKDSGELEITGHYHGGYDKERVQDAEAMLKTGGILGTGIDFKTNYSESTASWTTRWSFGD